MQLYISRTIIAVVLFASTMIATADDLNSLSTAAETCRQASIQLDWLSQHQTRPHCAVNLSDDAINVYYASKYILAHQLPHAQTILNAAIIQTHYTIDIGCDGQSNIQLILTNLQNVLQVIS